jgi:uncharacterized membrane protein YkvA (DUF1232 family)
LIDNNKIKEMKKQNIINLPLLWGKVREYGLRAGRTCARPVLLLYYVMKSPETPTSDKLLVFSALSYLILPIDLISAKRLPIIGWIDEIAAITVAYKKIRKHITPQIEAEVEDLLNVWFPEFSYEIVS